jgi:hypothetical protein
LLRLLLFFLMQCLALFLDLRELSKKFSQTFSIISMSINVSASLEQISQKYCKQMFWYGRKFQPISYAKFGSWEGVLKTLKLIKE